jgi:hypothetical protein
VNSGAQEGLAVPAPPMSRRSDDHIGIVINTKKQLFYRGSGFVLLSFWFSVWYFVDHCFFLFILAIVLSALLRFAASSYPFGTFKLFLT